MNQQFQRRDSDASAYVSSEESSYEEEDEYEKWIPWFCSQKGNEFFCEVDKEYILDEFNLAGLSNTVEHYQHALSMLLDEKDIEFGI